MSRVLVLVGLGLMLVAFGGLGLWTLRRLWRSDGSQYERFVYRYGVRYVGLPAWIVLSLVIPRGELGESVAQYAIGVLISAVLMLPLAFWGGYWWGRSMAGVFGVSTDD